MVKLIAKLPLGFNKSEDEEHQGLGGSVCLQSLGLYRLVLPPHRSLVKCCPECSQSTQILGARGITGNRGIFFVCDAAATLGKDQSDFALVDHEMYPAVWQCAKLVMGTEVSCLEHTSLKRAHRYGTVSSFRVCKGSQILLSSGLHGPGVTSFLCYAAVMHLASLLMSPSTH